MRTLGLVLVGVAGCANSAPSPIVLDCADTSCHGPDCADPGCHGSLGVGGEIEYTLYDGNDIVTASHLTVRDSSVVGIDIKSDDTADIVGVAPGTTELELHDDAGSVVARRSITVGEVSKLVLVSPSITANDEIPTNTQLVVGLEPDVGDGPSIGWHPYEVSLDGSLYTCWGNPRICPGPIHYQSLVLDPLAAGYHTLAFRALDGGRDWSFTLAAR